MWRGVAAVATVCMLLLAGCTSGSAPAPPPTGITSDGVFYGGGSGPSSPEPSRTPSGSTTPAAPRTATILGSGDVLVHPQVRQQAHVDAGDHGYDFAPMYASIAPDVAKANVATCELETPLASPQGPFSGYPTFNAPPQVLTALKGVGYTSCTTASNHSLDQGLTGVRRTLDALDAAGLKHTGSARSANEADTPLIVTLPNGVRVGQLAYTFGFNGIPLPAGEPWLANETDVPAILAAARRMKRAGADIVVLSMHWGTEYDHLATAEQKDEAATLLASPDIDLILGDHAHVVQPAQRIHGKWVFYCMGDQLSRHADPIAVSREGVMPRVTFTEYAPHRFRATLAEAIPTWIQLAPAIRLVDLPRALAAPGGLTAAQLRDDTSAHAAIARYLDAYGAVRDGLVVR